MGEAENTHKNKAKTEARNLYKETGKLKKKFKIIQLIYAFFKSFLCLKIFILFIRIMYKN